MSESIQVIIIYLHMKFRWNRTMLNLCAIVAAILKMATGRNVSMSGINSGHHYLPTYQILMISENVEFLRPFWKWRPLEIFQCREYIWDIIIYPHMKCRWNPTMLNLCGIVAAILKMATARKCSMSGINSGHHNLPTYEISLKSNNVEFVRYCGGHFENDDR
jgi:hypothetical protein